MSKWIHLLVATMSFSFWLWGDSAGPSDVLNKRQTTESILDRADDAIESLAEDNQAREILIESLQLIDVSYDLHFGGEIKSDRLKGLGLLLITGISLLAFILVWSSEASKTLSEEEQQMTFY